MSSRIDALIDAASYTMALRVSVYPSQSTTRKNNQRMTGTHAWVSASVPAHLQLFLFIVTYEVDEKV